MSRYDDLRNVNDLETRWRRVSSTHTLQDILRGCEEHRRTFAYRAKCFVGGMSLIGAGCFLVAAAIYFVTMCVYYPKLREDVYRVQPIQTYYWLLVPTLIPVTYMAVFVNWTSLKLFKHNS